MGGLLFTKLVAKQSAPKSEEKLLHLWHEHVGN